MEAAPHVDDWRGSAGCTGPGAGGLASARGVVGAARDE